jgi:hypothetical protein
MKKFIVIAVVVFSAALVAQAAYSDYVTEVLSLSPVRYYQMNETATTAGDALDDSSSSDVDGTWGQSADAESLPQSDVMGPSIGEPIQHWFHTNANDAARFDGDETRMQAGTASPADTENMSYAFFFRHPGDYGNDERLITNDPDNANDFKVILKGSSCELVITTSESGWNTAYEGMTSGTSLDGGAWHHIVVVRNGDDCNDVELYIDGVDYDWGNNQISSGDSHGTSGGSGEMQLGARHTYDAGWGTFSGDMDEVAIFDYALTASDAADLYDAAIPEPATLGLLAIGGVAALLRKRR